MVEYPIKPQISPNDPKKQIGFKKTFAIVVPIGLSVIALFFVWYSKNKELFYDLDSYMEESKEDWIDLGFEEKDEWWKTDDDNVGVMFDGDVPVVCYIGFSEKYNYLGLRGGMKKSDALSVINENFDELEQFEDGTLYEHKRKKIWLAVSFVDDKVDCIYVSREKDILVSEDTSNNNTESDKKYEEYTEETTEVDEYEFGMSDYILPYSDSVRITSSDIQYLSLQEINYAKNEIYARHGRKFKSKELNDYFNSKLWYYGYIDPEDFSESVFSQVEKDNIRFLSDTEFALDPNGYQLDQ